MNKEKSEIGVRVLEMGEMGTFFFLLLARLASQEQKEECPHFRDPIFLSAISRRFEP